MLIIELLYWIQFRKPSFYQQTPNVSLFGAKYKIADSNLWHIIADTVL